MMNKFSSFGLITGAVVGVIAILGLMISGEGDNPPAMQSYLVSASIIFGCGLIAGAIEKRR